MQEKKKFYYGWYMVLFGFLVMALAYASLASCQGISQLFHDAPPQSAVLAALCCWIRS